MIKLALKKFIVALRLQKLAYLFFNIYALFPLFRFQTIQRNGISYKVDLKESVDRGIFLLGWEPLTIQWLLSNLHPGDIVIEVGANVGAHSLIISKIIGENGQLYAFEPTNYAFKKLAENFNLNPSLQKNTDLIKSFVSDKQGTKIKFKIRSSWKINKTKSSADQMDENFFGEVITIDDFFKDISKINFIKIDVDGHDFKVLQGAEKTIKHHQPIVFVELYKAGLKKNGDSLQDILDFFSALNYSGVLENGDQIDSAHDLQNSLSLVTHSNGIFTPNIN